MSKRLPVHVVVVSRIQRICYQPKKTTGTLHGDQSRSWSAGQGKENKRKVWQHIPPHPSRCPFREKINKITRCIYMPRRYAGLGPSRVRTRIPSTRRLLIGQRVLLRKSFTLPCAITTFPVSLLLSSPGDV